MAQLTRKAPALGPVKAKEDGRCPFCPVRIHADFDFISKVEPVGWGHTHCVDGYCRTINEHLEEDE